MKTAAAVREQFHLAWAIDTGERGRLIGPYWWFGGEQPEIPNHMHGYLTAVFRTRREAKAALRWVKGHRPRARVVRVRITVEVLA